MKGIVYFIVMLCFISACQEVDLSGDQITPLPDSTSNSPDKKLEYLSEVIDDEPSVADYRYRRALIYMEKKQEKAALDDIEEALRLDPSQAGYYFVSAQIMTQQRHFMSALKQAIAAQSKGMKSTELDLLLGKLYYHNHQPIKAVEYLRKSQQVFTDHPEAHYYRGLISVDVGDTLTADQFLNQAIRARPDYRDAYRALIEVYSKTGRHRTALAYLQRAVEQPAFQREAEFFYLYGQTLSALKKKEVEVIPWYEKAVSLDSTMWRVSYLVGEYYIDKEEYEKAEAYLKKAIAANASLLGGHYKLGAIYEFHLKNIPAAKVAYEAAQKLAPQNEDIAESIRRVDKRIAYEEYKKSPQYIIDQLRKRREEELEKLQKPVTPLLPEGQQNNQ